MALTEWREARVVPIALGLEGRYWQYRLFVHGMPALDPQIGSSGGGDRQSPRLWQNTLALARRLDADGGEDGLALSPSW